MPYPWRRKDDRLDPRLIDRRNEVVRPVFLGGGAFIDLSSPSIRAMLDQGDPTGNYHQYDLPLESSSDRTGVPDVFVAQSMIYQFPRDVLGSEILGFSAIIGALNLIGHSTAFTGASPSFRADVRFYSDEIDPETIVWNDRAGLTLLGSAFTFNNNIITSSTETGVDIDVDLTVGGTAGASLGIFAEPSGLDSQTFRAVEILLTAPGVVDPTSGESSYAVAISGETLYLGDEA